jgi:hypothetical protein
LVGYPLNFVTQAVAVKPVWTAYHPSLVNFVGRTWMGNGVFFGYLLLNLWTSGLPAFPYRTGPMPYRLMLLIGAVVMVKLGLIAGLVRFAERGIGARG